ncbi:MAG: PAS domain S-box protein [Desulfobacter sp.]|nr:MAG: PAS domain S-box protein [Desulfobacter sp.]
MVIDSSPDFLFRTDMDGRFVFVSSSIFELTGYTVGEALSKDLTRDFYFNIEEQERFWKRLEADGSVRNFEIRLKKKDKSIWWASANAHYYRDEKGQLLGSEGVVRDVTLKKKSEQALKESENQLRAILKANPDPMIVYDLKGHPLYLNPAFTQVFGWTFDELKGKKIPFVPEDQVQKTLEKIKDIIEKGRSLTFETRRQTKEKKILDIILSAAVIKDDNKIPYGMMVNITDVSEQKRLEAQYEHAQKMESLGTLAGGIAHDFNNYLSGIFGYIDLARKYAKDQKTSGFLSKALKSSDRARALTHQLLTFSKGGTPIKEVNTLELFLKETARFNLSGSEVSCEFKFQKGLWACEFDPNQIGQVIDNIVINAVHAMPEQGSITIAAKNREVKADEVDVGVKPGKYVEISISDTGAGIRLEDMKRIFDPFFSTKPTGSGLGLATAYSIVNRYMGKIFLESVLGQGTCFYVVLPATGTTKGANSENKEFSYEGKGRILVMDDEPLVRDMLARMLESMGFSVVPVQDGTQAIDAFSKAANQGLPFCAVILDLTIPGAMGGKETVKKIREKDMNIPVFVASGYSESPVLADPEKFGFTAGIEKPFLISALGRMLNRHLPDMVKENKAD